MGPAAGRAVVPVAVTGGGGVEVTDVAAEAGHGSSAAGRRRRCGGHRAAADRCDGRPRRQRQLVTADRTARHAVQNLGQVRRTLQYRLLY